MRQQVAQRAAIARREHGHHRGSHHRFGLALMHLVRGRLRHHLGERLVHRELVRGDLMGDFVLAFVLGLEFAFVLSFELSFVLGLELVLAQQVGGQSAERGAERSADCRADDGRRGFGDLPEDGCRLLKEVPDAAKKVLATLELEFGLALEFMLAFESEPEFALTFVLEFRLASPFAFTQEAAEDTADRAENSLLFTRLEFALVQLMLELRFQLVLLHGCHGAGSSRMAMHSQTIVPSVCRARVASCGKSITVPLN